MHLDTIRVNNQLDALF